MATITWERVTVELEKQGYRATLEYPCFVLVALSNGVDLSAGRANATITVDASARDNGEVFSSFDTGLDSKCIDVDAIVRELVHAIEHFERVYDATAKGNEDETLTDYVKRTAIVQPIAKPERTDIHDRLQDAIDRLADSEDMNAIVAIAHMLCRYASGEQLTAVESALAIDGITIAGPENEDASGSVADSANRFHRSHGGDTGVLPIDCPVCVDRFDDRPFNYRTGDRRMNDSDLCDAIADRMIAIGVGESETGNNLQVEGANTGGGIYCVFFPVKDRPNLQWMAGMGGNTWGADLIARESGEYLQFDRWTDVSSDSQDVDAIAVALKAIADSTDIPDDSILFDDGESIERWKEKNRTA